ncbi:MAG: aminotransferase class I/II-fold pyridoxal phosphate-dependent enzyme [Peptoniphilus sp.]|nr:aminotransferase class I/II-fold pyridoxal phosphate-dependent enzyme [Peptoniphilus sp.]
MMNIKHIASKYQNPISTPMGASSGFLRKYPDLINFSLGDPDVTTPKIIIDSAYKDALAGHTHYTDFYGDPELIEEIVKFYKEEYDFYIEHDQVMVTTSACHGMWLVLEAICNEGDEIIIPSPYFTLYPHQVELCGGKPVFLETREEDGFQIDVDRLEKAITKKTKAIIINTPNNPTGACLSVENLTQIGKLAEKHDILIIADDIYTIYSYAEPFVPLGTLESFFDRTITIRSFSKDYSMTGWRLGYIVAPKNFIKVIKEINENNVFTAPSISQRGGVAALRNRKTIQPPLVEEFKKRTFHAYERLTRLKNVKISEPKGTFYLFPNIKATGLTSDEMAKVLLEEARVLVIQGNAFGDVGEGYIRIAVTVDSDTIDTAFDRIEKLKYFR